MTQAGTLSFSGSANITSRSIKKHFSKYEPWQVIAEMIWNGFDAGATRIDIEINKNKLGGFEVISIVDNGSGIDFENLEDSFKKFNDNIKSDAGKHGANGKGRLSFHKISDKATWYTKFKNKNASIYVESSDLRKYFGEIIDNSNQNSKLMDLESGTCVELTGFAKRKHSLNIETLPSKIASAFGWFLLPQKDRCIYINGIKVEIPEHLNDEFSVCILGNKFRISIVRWEEKPFSEKSYNYLLDSKKRIVHKQTSTFNNRARFHISAYAFSSWADKFDPEEPSLFKLTDDTNNSEIWKKLLEYLSEKTQKIYENFLREFAEEQINKFEENGAFSGDYGDDEETARWRSNNIKELVKNIYIADPTILNSLNPKQQKIIIRLLEKLMVSNENDALLEVLESVIGLNSEHIKSLSEQLKRTKLEHIVSTIEVLQKRAIVIQKLREVMNNHYKTVLETPDLQKIIEANTWLFGSQYSILGAEEDDFLATAKRFREEIPGIHSITKEDIEETGEDIEGAKKIEGVRRQVDLFMARKIPERDTMGRKYYKCIIIEIKRPGIALNDKHLQQIEDYTSILNRQAEYQSESMKFEIILIGRTISSKSFHIPSRLQDNADKGEVGLVGTGKFKRYIKSWYTVFDQFELANEYLMEHLKIKREDLTNKTKNQLIHELQQVSE